MRPKSETFHSTLSECQKVCRMSHLYRPHPCEVGGGQNPTKGRRPGVMILQAVRLYFPKKARMCEDMLSIVHASGPLAASPHARPAAAGHAAVLLRRRQSPLLAARCGAAPVQSTWAAKTGSLRAVLVSTCSAPQRAPVCSWCPTGAACAPARCPGGLARPAACLPALPTDIWWSCSAVSGAVTGGAGWHHCRGRVAGGGRAVQEIEADPVYLSYDGPCLRVRHFFHVTLSTASIRAHPCWPHLSCDV